MRSIPPHLLFFFCFFFFPDFSVLFCVFYSLCASPSGRPSRVRRGDGHGDGALRPGWSRLRHQSLLLRLHPERGQVHLPEEVRCLAARGSALGAVYFTVIIFFLTLRCC